MALTIGIMVFASIYDIKKMEVSDIPWFIGIGAGILLLAFELITSGPHLELIWIPMMLILSYLIGYFGLFGGADAKSLFAIVLLNPMMPTISLVQGFFPVALSLLINSCIILIILYPFIKEREEIPFLPIMTVALIASYLISDPLSYLFAYTSLA